MPLTHRTLAFADSNDIMKIKTLLYAHLLREPVPAALAPDMNYVLEHTHHLLNGVSPLPFLASPVERLLRHKSLVPPDVKH